MANTLIQQTALDIVFGGETATLDYDTVVENLEKGGSPWDAVPDDVHIWEHFETLDADGLYAVLDGFVDALTKFACDVLVAIAEA